MGKKYLYKVYFRKTNWLLDAYYSCLVERDEPILTKEDENEVKDFVSTKHKFSKIKCLRYQLIEKNGKNHPEIPF